MGYSPWGHKESDMTEQLTHTHTHIYPDTQYLIKEEKENKNHCRPVTLGQPGLTFWCTSV